MRSRGLAPGEACNNLSNAQSQRIRHALHNICRCRRPAFIAAVSEGAGAEMRGGFGGAPQQAQRQKQRAFNVRDNGCRPQRANVFTSTKALSR